MQKSVKEDRNLYIGGSDIPVILGISPFKTRYELLLEKAKIDENDFEGNVYTEYGNIMEDKIRQYINEEYNTNFTEDKLIKGDIRCHVDGFNGKKILEIKTTSQIHDNIDGYKIYLSQLLFYMENYELEEGLLAVYRRPEDFDEIFNPDLLTVYEIDMKTYEGFVKYINKEVNRFREDLVKIKENPLLSEEDLIPVEIRNIAKEIEVIETQIIEYKALEKKQKDLKDMLYKTMLENGIKGWEMPNTGTKVSLVMPQDTVIVNKFNEEEFKKDNPELYKKYLEPTTKKGKSGYVLITLKKDK